MSDPIGTVTWWELPTSDVARAQEFYTAVFGWGYVPFGGPEDEYAGVTSGGEDLVGGIFRTDDPPATGIRTYVNVADLEAVLAAVEAAGGTVVVPRTEIGDGFGWWAEITAPDGHWLGICTGAPPAS